MSGLVHPDQNVLNATQNSLCRAVNRRRGCCACRASNCRRRARFSRTRSSREWKALSNQRRKCRSDTIMARIVAEKSESSFSQVIHSAGVRRFGEPQVFTPYENDNPPRVWWESIDMADALHPQTLLAYGMNGADLPMPHGAPLRLKVPRQLGYKNTKYLYRVTVTDSVAKIGKGLGGSFPEDGYSWYAGI